MPTDAAPPQPLPKPNGSKKWLRHLRMLALAGVITVVLTEILLRLIFGLGTPVLYQPDPYTKTLVQPDQNLRRFFARNKINHYSMRSDDFAMPRPKDHLRIMCIGDSVTYGTTYVDQSLLFTTRIAASLTAIEHKPVEVLNASMGGWAIDNEVGYLMSRGTFDSNVVFLVLNSGDPAQSAQLWVSNSLGMPQQRPWTAIGETWSRYVAPRLFGQSVADTGTTLPTMDEQTTTELANQKLLLEANDFCQKHGAAFGIIYVPFPSWTGSDAENPHGWVTAWTTLNHVPLIDVAPALASEKVDAISLDGLHLKPYGHEIVAREITRQWPTIDAYLPLSPSPK